MKYHCCESERRQLTLGSALNGIDFLEVIDHDAANPDERQRVVLLHFLKPVTTLGLDAINILITGGERITNIRATDVVVLAAPDNKVARITLDRYGDFSTYTLSVVRSADDPDPGTLAEMDPRLSALDFSFKVQCPTDFDCHDERACPPLADTPTNIDYLARDYPSFRRLILDRMSVNAPSWTERNAADLGITLAEILAYAADHISYKQDAAATEAYIETARRRTSVRRHARLMDYRMSEGSNARAWIHLRVSANQGPPPPRTRFLTRLPSEIEAIVSDDPGLYAPDTVVFEQLEAPTELRVAHNEMRFYTWSASNCCLPIGATRATLAGEYPNLRAGDVLLFEEVLGPRTGEPADAKVENRAVVRLERDALVGRDPVTNQAITEIVWLRADALSFPLCISSITEQDQSLENISVARANMLLADHGRSIVDEALGEVPPPTLSRALRRSSHCEPSKPDYVWPRFRPQLARGPLTQAAGHDARSGASQVFNWSAEDVVPEISLRAERVGQPNRAWESIGDLLNADAEDRLFVVETEDDGRATLRFGDGENGRRPVEATRFFAGYRIGNGRAGNVGADALVHIAGGFADIELVRNPLPARGGEEPEPTETVRQRAPVAYRTQERAVTTEDYARRTERVAGVQRAAASLRWTGSWHSVFVTVDQENGAAISPTQESAYIDYLDEFRMAGHDLNINEPHFVSLEIDLFVCCDKDHLRSEVRRALYEVLGSTEQADGSRGLFHPDNFTFGQSVYLSPIYSAAQCVPGVSSVDIRVFRRLGDLADTQSIRNGILKLDRLEIARLDNDPNFAERGILRIEMGGGR